MNLRDSDRGALDYEEEEASDEEESSSFSGSAGEVSGSGSAREYPGFQPSSRPTDEAFGREVRPGDRSKDGGGMALGSDTKLVQFKDRDHEKERQGTAAGARGGSPSSARNVATPYEDQLTRLRNKLLHVGERFVGFDRAMEQLSVMRRETEERRLDSLQENLGRTERQLHSEVTRRGEHAKTLQLVTENCANAMLDRVQKRIQNHMRQVVAALDSLAARCLTLERAILQFRGELPSKLTIDAKHLSDSVNSLKSKMRGFVSDGQTEEEHVESLLAEDGAILKSESEGASKDKAPPRRVRVLMDDDDDKQAAEKKQSKEIDLGSSSSRSASSSKKKSNSLDSTVNQGTSNKSGVLLAETAIRLGTQMSRQVGRFVQDSDKMAADISSGLEMLAKRNETEEKAFQDFVSSELKVVKRGVDLEGKARQKTDEEILNAINVYSGALQKALRTTAAGAVG
ncbi:unnamed protein product [Amoebophrya sp. A25]|nr:unnamed protein product [Amoebophrya sp. A25]|eukprot:GSA25T00013989001.1